MSQGDDKSGVQQGRYRRPVYLDSESWAIEFVGRVFCTAGQPWLVDLGKVVVALGQWAWASWEIKAATEFMHPLQGPRKQAWAMMEAVVEVFKSVTISPLSLC